MTRDRDLDERIRQVLAELSVLSDVGAAQIGKSSRSSEHELPRGVNPSVRRPKGEQPPPKDRNLYDFYSWQFARATNDQARRVLLYLAESDLAARKRTAPADRTALGQSKASTTSTDQRDQRILTWYIGVHPLEAAILESTHGGYCPEQNVRDVRRKARRDPLTGHPLDGWAGWSDEDRVKRVNQLLGRGLSLSAIASEVGTAKSNVQRVVDRLRRRAA